MKTTVNFSEFCNAFTAHDRAYQYSYDAKKMIFDYFENLEEDTGEEIELDVIAICCDIVEMHMDDIAGDYAFYDAPDELAEWCELDPDEQSKQVENFLNENTIVIGKTASGNFVFFEF